MGGETVLSQNLHLNYSVVLLHDANESKKFKGPAELWVS